ncbi:MAG: ATP-binding cassette domain-containing protein [Phycisphaerales bacterium JB060]
MTQTATTQQPGAPSQPESSTRPVLAVQGLSKTFRDFWMRPRARAVMDVTFEIRPHEIFGLLGPNGSGKSTIIKIMLGLLKPTKGRVAVFGRSPSDVQIKKRIGYLPEESYLYPFLNARETLDYYGRLFGLDHGTRQKRIDELLEMVGLKAAQYRQVREYSKGMQRRIGLAQALINDPDLLILDEPTTGLDPIGTRQVKDLIVELGRRGKTVLLSSHLLADVEDVVDRMVVLYGGRIRKEGTREQLLDATDRTTIEADTLDEATLAEIDEVIRRRTGGARAVQRVSHPRQKLEELFMQIVEEAQAERLETAGATSGGLTAEFLRSQSEQRDEGEALISDLVREEPEPQVEASQEAQPEPEPQSVDEVVVEELLEDEPKPEPKQADAEVDLGMIGSLLDEPEGRDEDDADDGAKGKGRAR